jgi:hypothetical protein
MNTWTIYRRPPSEPYGYAARRFEITKQGAVATHDGFTARSLPEIRALLPKGLVRMTRSPDDAPEIVETWI